MSAKEGGRLELGGEQKRRDRRRENKKLTIIRN